MNYVFLNDIHKLNTVEELTGADENHGKIFRLCFQFNGY